MRILRPLLFATALSACALACSSAPDPVDSTSEGVCTEAYDWHDFPTGYQCVGGVDAFFSAHFGVSLPALCQYPTQQGCASCGACEFWVANAPNPAVWDRLSTGSPQLFDMIVYPPTSGNATCPHTVSWPAYGWYRLKSLEDRAPAGWLDSADCTQIAGWAWDPDTASQGISVDLYFDGPAGTGKGVRTTANETRSDLCTAIGSCDHGYTMPTPLSLMDGNAHTVHAYGIDTSGNGDNPLLQGAPKSFTCATPSIPFSPAVKRHVASPTVWSAWKIDALTDVAHLSDPQIAALAQTADTPASPALVTPDDGSAGVFIVDGEVVRHVQDPASMTAWHFDWNAIAKVPAATFATMPQGLPWPEKPFFVQDSSGAVYMVDGTTSAPPPIADAGSDANGDRDGGSGRPPRDTPGASGCNASRGAPSDGAWALLLGAASLVRRCRRARPTRARDRASTR